MSHFGLPFSTEDERLRGRNLKTDLDQWDNIIKINTTDSESRRHARDLKISSYVSNYENTSIKQKKFIDDVMNFLSNGEQFLGFLNAFYGTGKTFTFNIIL